MCASVPGRGRKGTWEWLRSIDTCATVRAWTKSLEVPHDRPMPSASNAWWALRAAWLDLKFGGYTGGRARSRYAHRQSTDVHNIGYRGVADAMRGIPVAPEDVLVDVGCGRGRVLNYWLSLGLANRLVGIELDPALAAETRTRLRRFPQVEVRTGDAVELTPTDATVCFLFNPFGGAVLRRWRDETTKRARGQLRVIYVHPLHRGAFEEARGWSVRVRPGVGFGDVAVAEFDARFGVLAADS